MLSDPIKFDKETVPCELCGRDTRMLGTKRCDGCWELETRIRGDISMTLKILERNHNMKIIEVKRSGDCPFIRSVPGITGFQENNYNFVCDMLRLSNNGRTRCIDEYPPKHCPLHNGNIMITIKGD